ncbi:MAG: hypothetical protein ABJI92_05360 [Kangiellaceae bacterium]
MRKTEIDSSVPVALSQPVPLIFLSMIPNQGFGITESGDFYQA